MELKVKNSYIRVHTSGVGLRNLASLKQPEVDIKMELDEDESGFPTADSPMPTLPAPQLLRHQHKVSLSDITELLNR